MTTQIVTPHRSPLTPERESFWHLVHGEWTKFRTVRGWVIAAGVTIVAITAFVFIAIGVHSVVRRAPRRVCLPGAADRAWR